MGNAIFSMSSRRVLPCLWLVVLATGMTSELHAAEETLSLGKTDPIDKLPPMVNAGLTNMGEWADANKALEKTNNKLRKRLSVPWETKLSKDCCDYHEIPWFRFGYMGKTFKNKSKGECETMCNQYIGCKSFSYNFKDKECVWSSQKPTYSADWRFYSKITNLQGKPNGKYHMFPGMKFLEPSKDIKHKISLQQCQYACTKDLGCKSFSYSQSKLECSTGETNVGYSESWQFFEKDLSKFKKPGFTEKHEKENTQKEETKRNYMFDIDKHNREKMAKRKQEVADKAMLERKVKNDKNKKEKVAKKDEKLMKKSEKCAKVSNKADERNKKIVAKDKVVTQKMNKARKAAEVLQKAKLKAQHAEKKMKLQVKIATAAKNLGALKQTHRQNKILEVNAKKTKRSDMEKCRKSLEKQHKEDKKMKERKIKAWEAKQAAKAAAREKKSKTCKKDVKAEQARDAEIKATEKAAKKSLAVKESQTARWAKKAKLATKEGHKKKAVEKLKEAKEITKKAKSKEQRRVAKEIRFERATKAFKEKCAKKEKKKKEKALKVKKKEAEIAAKKKAKEEGEKRVLKEAAVK